MVVKPVVEHVYLGDGWVGAALWYAYTHCYFYTFIDLLCLFLFCFAKWTKFILITYLLIISLNPWLIFIILLLTTSLSFCIKFTFSFYIFPKLNIDINSKLQSKKKAIIRLYKTYKIHIKHIKQNNFRLKKNVDNKNRQDKLHIIWIVVKIIIKYINRLSEKVFLFIFIKDTFLYLRMEQRLDIGMWIRNNSHKRKYSLSKMLVCARPRMSTLSLYRHQSVHSPSKQQINKQNCYGWGR